MATFLEVPDYYPSIKDGFNYLALKHFNKDLNAMSKGELLEILLECITQLRDQETVLTKSKEEIISLEQNLLDLREKGNDL